jgi:hypothetical protein
MTWRNERFCSPAAFANSSGGCHVRSAIMMRSNSWLVRTSGSVGADDIEANESLGKKDFLMRIRISRKESKECRYGLR